MGGTEGRIETLFDGTIPIGDAFVLSPPIATKDAGRLVLFGGGSGGTFGVMCFFALEATDENTDDGVPAVPNFLTAVIQITGGSLLYHQIPDLALATVPPWPVLGPFFQCSARCTSQTPCGRLTLHALLLE